MLNVSNQLRKCWLKECRFLANNFNKYCSTPSDKNLYWYRCHQTYYLNTEYLTFNQSNFVWTGCGTATPEPAMASVVFYCQHTSKSFIINTKNKIVPIPSSLEYVVKVAARIMKRQEMLREWPRFVRKIWKRCVFSVGLHVVFRERWFKH